MKKKIKILVILLLLVNSVLFGAKTYRKGYIKTGGDSISCFVEESEIYKGKIKYKLFLDEKKALRIDESSVIELKCGTKIYDRVFVNSETSHLMHRLVFGKIRFYKFSYYVYSPGTIALKVFLEAIHMKIMHFI